MLLFPNLSGAIKGSWLRLLPLVAPRRAPALGTGIRPGGARRPRHHQPPRTPVVPQRRAPRPGRAATLVIILLKIFALMFITDFGLWFYFLEVSLSDFGMCAILAS
jgi:hypothetical protein